MIYTFYSYKGGVGRSLLLVHTGIILAAERRDKNYKILLIDMDLEAPGFDAYVRNQKSCPVFGFAGLLRGYRENQRQMQWLEENIENESYIAQVFGTPNLFYMPSGIKAGTSDTSGHTYLDVVRDLASEIPSTRSPSAPKTGFFHDLGCALRDRFTYVLVDSRSGLAEQAYASSLLLADALVLCFRLNRMNIDGVARVYANFLIREKKCVGSTDIPVIPVATPVPPRGGTDIENWIAAIGGEAQDRTKESKADLKEYLDRTFPPIQRIFVEPSLEIGEKLIFNTDGTLKEGFSEQTPIVNCLHQLADRVASMNCDKDALQAEKIEQKLYEAQDYKGALEYFLKILRLEIFNLSNWEHLIFSYSNERKCRTQVDKFLNEMIRDLRGDLQLESNKRKLTYALYAWALGYGQDQIDAGLSRISECLDLISDDSLLEEKAHVLFGKVIEKLLSEQAALSVFKERMGVDVSFELANEHYSKAIELGKYNVGKGGKALLYRARNLAQLNNNKEAIRDFDSYLIEISSIEGSVPNTENISVLYQESEVLSFMGRYDLALRNLRKAISIEPIDTDVAQELCSLAYYLELTEFAEEIATIWKREVPRSIIVHWLKALIMIIRKKMPEALEQIDLAESLFDRNSIKVLEVFFHLFKTDYEKACEICDSIVESDDEESYRALHAICLKMAGKKNIPGLIVESKTREFWKIRSIGAIAIRELELARGILQQAREEKFNVQDQAFYHLLRVICVRDVYKKSDPSKEFIQQLFDLYPLLPIILRNDIHFSLLRLVLERLKFDSFLMPMYLVAREIIDFVEKQEAPSIDDFPPRDLSERLPVY